VVIDTTAVIALAQEAGVAILEVYHRDGAMSVERKGDDSPLTEADTRSHAVIVAGLAALTPEIPVVSEEDGQALGATEEQRGWYWLVDPLDGTKEFVKRTGEFTVNIALIHEGAPVFGVVHAPVLDSTWIGDRSGAELRRGSDRTPIGSASAPALEALRLVASRDHAGEGVRALLARLPDAATLSMGSSLKFCLVAEGRADLYYRDGPTMPWDTAAAHAVLAAAGGEVYATSGEPLRYLSPRMLNPHFVAVGDRAFPWASLLTASDTP
jgi:3'(2'), 5'-bisphosphate nucleotidase